MIRECAEIVSLVGGDDESRRAYAAMVSILGLAYKEYATVETFLAQADLARPGCAIVDFCPGELDGRDLCRRLAEARSHLPVIMVSTHWSTSTAVEALKAGVFHVLEKPCDVDEMVRIVRDAIDTCRESCERQRREVDLKYRLDQLHPRERTVLDLILAGSPNKTLQRQLRVSRRTVERDRAAILEKMHTMSFIELATTLTRAGIASAPER